MAYKKEDTTLNLNIINDEIYGEFEIDNVLIELIKSSPMRRLKNIHQGGSSFLVNPNWNITRYEHSVGVMLLIKKLGGSLNEQIAGLLHDVSHTAFSHVIDYVLDEKNEDYHEKIFEETINNGEIKGILSKYKIEYDDIFNDKNYILDSPLPNLCADRIDYTLRDMFRYKVITKGEIDAFLNDLIVVNDNVCLKSIQIGEWFTDTYYKEVIGYFMNPLNVYANYSLTEVLKQALSLKIVTLDDFLLDDYTILKKIKDSDNIEIKDRLNKISPNVKLAEDDVNYTIEQKLKARVVNPYIVKDNKLLRSSYLSDDVKNKNICALDKLKSGVRIKII